jgi:Ca2+/Na+ antiporter
MGAASVLRPLPVERSILLVETPLMIGLSILLLPFVYKLCLERWEGGVLLAGYGAFLIWIFT